MQPKYRNIIENFELTRVEAETLNSARAILADICDWIDSCNAECDNDFAVIMEEALDRLETANSRLNVNTRLEED